MIACFALFRPQIMKDFPEDLRGEISLQLNREILSLPVFEAATQGCLRSVALQTNRVFFGPGEVLIHKGDAIRNIYYVCSGSLEVLKDEQVVAILGTSILRSGTTDSEILPITMQRYQNFLSFNPVVAIPFC